MMQGDDPTKAALLIAATLCQALAIVLTDEAAAHAQRRETASPQPSRRRRRRGVSVPTPS